MPSPEPTGGVRSQQVRATRRAIVAAAGELFVEQGYASTTIDAIATRAGVGRKTVFSSVGGKAALLKLVWDWTLSGDDEPVPMAERPAVRAILAEPDPARMVRLWVDMIVEVGARATPVGAVVLAAADVDDEARALRDTIRRESLAGATGFVTHLAGTGGLRADLTVERAADACWALVNSVLLHLLVNVRGWSRHEYAEWLVRLASATLLEPERAAAAQARSSVRVVHDPARQRYQAVVGDRVVGHLAYERTERLVVLTRTEVDRGGDDLGVPDALVRGALDDIAADGSRRVVALCHYVAWWVERHPTYASVLYDARGH